VAHDRWLRAASATTYRTTSWSRSCSLLAATRRPKAPRPLQGNHRTRSAVALGPASCSWACASNAPSATPSVEKWGQALLWPWPDFLPAWRTSRRPTAHEVVFCAGGRRLEPIRDRRRCAPGPWALDQRVLTGRDRRTATGEWMTAPDNPFLRASDCQPLWAHYFGRGLVTPIDDLRATNPASNGALLSGIVAAHARVKYDLKAFTRTAAQLHGLSAQLETNSSTQRRAEFFARRRKGARGGSAAGRDLPGRPASARNSTAARRLPRGAGVDSSMPSTSSHLCRPTRVSVCECERSNERASHRRYT